MKRYPLLFSLLILNFSLFSQIADFNMPDTVCINQSISIQNTSTGGTSFYWNFCSGNLANTPLGLNMGNIGSLNRPVYSSIAHDGNDYFVFICNIQDGTITRLAFGNSLTNNPIATNLGNLGVMGYYIEGIQIKKDSVTGKWFGLVAWGQVDNLIRLDFGNSLNNVPIAENLGNIGSMMSFSHTIYTFYEGGNWYSFIGNNGNSTIIRLNFGNSLGNSPSVTNLGNIGGINGPVGLYPIQENGIWYMFVVNRDDNSLSRLNFGNSLLNSPTGVNIGDIGGSMNYPRSITFLKDCGKIFGFVVNEGTNDIVRLIFPNGLMSSPTGVSLGNIANFSFPHHISELFRVGDSLYTFIMNVDNNTISRLCFASCNNASIPSSNLQNPPAFSYHTPGFYNVSLVVNEGLPSQSSICKEVFVKEPSSPTVTGDTVLCAGDTLNLISSTNPGDSFLWKGPDGFLSINQNLTLPNVNINNAGKYTLTVSGCANAEIDKMVSVAEGPTIAGDTLICAGDTLRLTSIIDADNSYLWSGPNSFFSTNQNLTIPEFNATQAGKYTLSIGSCANTSANALISIAPGPLVNLGNDTLICQGSTIILNAGNPGSNYQWNTGAISQTIPVEIPGSYSVVVSNGSCISSDDIFIDNCGSELWFPNVFTPNYDGLNERFKPVSLRVIGSYQITIFNRWGQKLYESNDAYAGWDGTFNGKICPDGVYYYLAEYILGLQSSSFDQRVTRGAVTVLR
jgi:gliding motility-associated-like protein